MKMETGAVKCYVAQMRRELRNFDYALGEIERLIDNPDYTAYCGSNASGIAYHMQELCDTRKYFNCAFRYLRDELDDTDE